MGKFVGSFIVLFFVSIFVTVPVFAQTATGSGTQTIEQQSSYQLPYPGLLPDNPLYFLKTLRDAIVGALISDPLKKAQFDLLTSDKRMYAAWMLDQQEKDDLAVTTLSKSNNYFSEAISTGQTAKLAGRDTSQFVNQMKASVVKHYEIAQMMESDIGKKQKGEVLSNEKQILQFAKELHVSP